MHLAGVARQVYGEAIGKSRHQEEEGRAVGSSDRSEAFKVRGLTIWAGEAAGYDSQLGGARHGPPMMHGVVSA